MGLEILGAIGSVVDGLMNAWSTDMTNQNNWDISQSGQKFQARQNAIARKFTQYMWNKENQYNTPSAQMQRYREAGINPFLAQSAVGAGESSPAPTPGMQSAPNMPTMQPLFKGDMFTRAFEVALQKKSVDANSANQQAQSLVELAEASQKLAETFGIDKARQIVEPYLKTVGGVNYESGVFWKNVDSKARENAANADLAQLNYNLENEFGKQKYERIISKFDYEYSESVARVGVMHTVTELNHSLVSVNKARIGEINASMRELLARAMLHFLQGDYYKQLGLTESQAREWFVGKLRSEAGAASLDFLDIYADWLESGDIRDYKSSDEAQEKALENYRMNNDPTYNAINKVLDTGGKAVGVAEPFVTRKSKSIKVNGSKPTYRRVKESRTPQGYKQREEWYGTYKP